MKLASLSLAFLLWTFALNQCATLFFVMLNGLSVFFFEYDSEALIDSFEFSIDLYVYQGVAELHLPHAIDDLYLQEY